jgi:hypothetical protein
MSHTTDIPSWDFVGSDSYPIITACLGRLSTCRGKLAVHQRCQGRRAVRRRASLPGLLCGHAYLRAGHTPASLRPYPEPCRWDRYRGEHLGPRSSAHPVRADDGAWPAPRTRQDQSQCKGRCSYPGALSLDPIARHRAVMAVQPSPQLSCLTLAVPDDDDTPIRQEAWVVVRHSLDPTS